MSARCATCGGIVDHSPEHKRDMVSELADVRDNLAMMRLALSASCKGLEEAREAAAVRTPGRRR